MTTTPEWRTATASDGMQCVEVGGVGGGRIGIRHSKGEPDYSREEFGAFIDGVKKGEFDDLGV
jgi:hypothetical protein